MTPSIALDRAGGPRMLHPVRGVVRDLVVGAAVLLATVYGLVSDNAYRDLPEATLVAARAQDVCSVLVAGVLLALARHRSATAHLVRLGLLAYVAYSYAIYLIGIPMNRAFLVYVLLVSLSLAAFIDGVVRLYAPGWPRTRRRRLERGTGWFLAVVACGFGLLWLSAVVPFAFGGPVPSPAGPGGVAYPVYVLDLVIVLPCVAAVALLMLRGHPIAGPLGVVVLVKVITLFTALWAGVVVALLTDVDVELGADALPSLVMVAVCLELVRRWVGALHPDPERYVRPDFWPLQERNS